MKGAAGGDIAGALAGAAAPYVAEVIGHRSGLEDGIEKAAAHAVANAALAAMQVQSALAGAAGAVAGELAGSIAKEMYGKEVAELSESQKQTISSLATIAAGIAGGLAGNGTAAAVAGSQSGKGVVENNALGDKDKKLTIIDIRPGWLKPGILDEDGEPFSAGGGIAKGGKSKDTQIWTETKKAEPVGNAYGHWTKNGKEFPEYQNAKQYVDASHNFVTNPPTGTLIATRKNGDTIYYNPTSNTFAVKNADGVPKTMFRPDPADHGYPTNLDYSMHKNNELYICRVCGAEQLDAPWGDDGESPAYDICDCCGVEFGYEDSTLQGIKIYREKWLGDGAKWNYKKSEPENWHLEEQLSHIPVKYL